MNWLLLHTFRRVEIVLGLMIMAALSLGLATPASAAGPKEVITASFDSSTGVLKVNGNNLNNTITISRDGAGTILVNGGAVPVTGGTPSVANTKQIQVLGRGGNDQLALDESSGAMPSANMAGGQGNDTLIGGSGADQLLGEAGDDTLIGKGGNDQLLGGADIDTLTGGDADDQVYGEGGNDRMVWNPGDDTDLNEGGDGIDTVEVNGGGGSEIFSATANGTRVRFDRTDPAPISIDIGTSEKLVLNANGGDDRFSATGNLAALIQIAVDGGTGNDTLLGSNGNDTLLGGDGNDFIDGQQGNDVAQMGVGDDTFQWDPGDGSDTAEGQDGSDTMLFNGANIAENINVASNSGRVRLTRDVGTVTMDLNDTERVDFNPLGGNDTITMNDLAGTDVTQLNTNLAGMLGGTAGDGVADTIIVNGTAANDSIDIFGSGTSANVIGLPVQVNITNSEGASDSLVINTLGGADAVRASTLPANVIKVTSDGGTGDDTLLGSGGNDTLLGGDGNDFIDGQQGNDAVQMGAGDDTFQWDPGDGSDMAEGQDGADRMVFYGANITENIDISANGGRVRFTRDVANIVMDLNAVEAIDYSALGGNDNIVVGDLSGTNTTQIGVELRGPNGGGDGAPDTITVNGTTANDTIAVSGSAANGVTVAGLPATVNIKTPEGANDSLTVNAQGGDDVVDASKLEANVIKFITNGGLGVDTITGSQGGDLVNGGDGNDIALMGAGDDTFQWNPGDDNDTIEGQSGSDTMLFNGANVAENIDISANGERVRFTRDVAGVTTDLNDTEQINFNALGGNDTIAVNNLAGTDLIEINIDLAAAGASGDGQPDTVLVSGTSGDDVIQVVGDASGASAVGLAARVNIRGAEAANDRLIVNALAGDDVVDGTGLAAAAIQLTADGGDGADVLMGGAGNDTLLGGAGDDVLIGGPGADVLDGGSGNNILIQD
jgi:Ca2+-binding RTX toxin-like protein